MKVVVWPIFHLWGGIWMMRYLWTSQRRQNFWCFGAARSAWWIFGKEYYWMLNHWRGEGKRKCYIWRKVQVCNLWDKEEFWQYSFISPYRGRLVCISIHSIVTKNGGYTESGLYLLVINKRMGCGWVVIGEWIKGARFLVTLYGNIT